MKKVARLAIALVAAMALSLSCAQVDPAQSAAALVDARTIGTGETVAAGRPITPSSEALDLAPRWKKGDKVAYEFVKSRRRTVPGKPNIDTTSRTPVTLEVLESGWVSHFVHRRATTADGASQVDLVSMRRVG